MSSQECFADASSDDVDVIVLGAGPAGLAATLSLAQAGFSTLCIDRAAPVVDPSDAATDMRTAALLEPSIALLERLGVWAEAAPYATELAVMRVIDAPDPAAPGAAPGEASAPPRARVDFEARELDRPTFGANIANADLRRVLLDAVARTSGATLAAPAAATALALRDDAALATLDDGRRLRARLIVGADGRESQLRKAMGVGARRIRYGQQAMVFAVRHAPPHQNVSTEIYREGGPFTLVPHLPAADGGWRSVVVWMETDQAAERLMALEPDAFSAAATERSLGVLGALRLDSARQAYPIMSLLADTLYGRRGALIAEAAHVVPPVGAQGLNLSLADVAALTETLTQARAANRDIGAEATLALYGRPRWREAAARVAATAALDLAAIGPIRPIRDARAAALNLLERVTPLRRTAMRFGLGR